MRCERRGASGGTGRVVAAALFLLVGRVSAQALPVPEPSELLKAEARLLPSSETEGVLRVDAILGSGWHVNSHHPSEDYLIATEVQVAPVAGATIGAPRYPEGRVKKFAFAEKPLSVYEERFSIEIPVSWKSAGAPRFIGTIGFQACNDRQCLAPASITFSTGGAPASTNAPTAGAPGAPGPPGEAAGSLRGGAVPLSQAPKEASGFRPAAGASADFGELLERRGLPVMLLVVFVWGLALNLTPCVYPMIPLTVSFFGGQEQEKGRRVFLLATLYVLGMATMYSALGVAAALSGKLFGSALQSPWVLAGIAFVLVLLALSMFGLYDIRMPSSWMQKAGARRGSAGAYAMGLLVGIVAAPCVGPVVLALLTFVASRQNAALGFLFFFILSLGLGLPYLFLAAFSGNLSRLPRAGEWMVGVKAIFGWVLIAMAAYFLRTVVPAPAGRWLLPAVLLASAVALTLQSKALRALPRFAAAVLFLAAAVFFAPRQVPASATPDWRPYSAADVAGTGRPAVIDFSASWCAPCLELDEKTFSDPRVREKLARRALFKADLTRAGSPEAVALSERYAILGVPTVIFLDASGKERTDLRLVGFEDADAFLERLSKAP